MKRTNVKYLEDTDQLLKQTGLLFLFILILV